MFPPNIHTIIVYRNALTSKMIYGRSPTVSSMTPISLLKIRCAACRSREGEWLIPLSDADGLAYVAGAEIEAPHRSEV